MAWGDDFMTGFFSYFLRSDLVGCLVSVVGWWVVGARAKNRGSKGGREKYLRRRALIRGWGIGLRDRSI